MVNYSLGEIDSLARKATRGAGYSWGMAEEAGKSARWLSAYGFSGADILAQYLTLVAHKSHEYTPSLVKNVSDKDKAPNNKTNEQIAFENNRSDNNRSDNDDHSICSLIAGTLINDLGHQLKGNKVLTFNNMLSPLLALSQAGRVAEAYDIKISFSYADTVIICGAIGIRVESNTLKDTPPLISNMLPTDILPTDIIGEDNLQNSSFDVSCSRVVTSSENTHFPSPQSRSISAEVLTILEQFAHATYAPATEESRLKGAG
jgi:hypothetical protein